MLSLWCSNGSFLGAEGSSRGLGLVRVESLELSLRSSSVTMSMNLRLRLRSRKNDFLAHRNLDGRPLPGLNSVHLSRIAVADFSERESRPSISVSRYSLTSSYDGLGALALKSSMARLGTGFGDDTR